MKESSIEEKAKVCDGNYKTYTELINRLEGVKDAIKKQNYGIAMDILCKPYPQFQVITHSELKESEDEKVRRVLREIVFQWKNGHQAWCSDDKEIDTILAWLEKQGDKKDICETCDHPMLNCQNFPCDEKRDEQNPQIKLVFPKFRVGDIIQHIPLEKWDTTKKITHIDETGYYFDHSHQGDTVSGGFIGFLSENDYELVEQKPACSEEEVEIIDWLVASFDCLKIPTDTFYQSKVRPFLISLRNKIQPIRKEWSEEDLVHIENCISLIGKTGVGEVKWLQSLKDRVPPQQEWSKDDEIIANALTKAANDNVLYGYIGKSKLLEWLKSLRPQKY